MRRSKQIILIRSTYSPYGGVERVTVSLINGLLQKEALITLLTLPKQQWPLSDTNLKIAPVGMHRGHRLLQAWSFNRAVNRYLKNHKSDCVISLDKVTNFTHLHAGGGTHKTFLKIKNQYSSPLSRFFRQFSFFHRYILYLEKKGFENTKLQKVRCNSQMVKHEIQNEYNVAPNKLIVVHSGICWQEIGDIFLHRIKVGQQLCHTHNIDPHWRSLLFLGSGFSRKGLAIAIQGFAEMPSDYHLIVVGKGSSQRYHRLAAAYGVGERVHFLGSHPKGWRYASFCKALLLPSQYDPFGGAAAEGHAMGLPVLVSDKTGYADWVKHGQNGIILKTPMHAEQIKNAFGELSQLIEEPKWTPQQIRDHARNVDDDVILNQLLEHFLQI